MRVITSYSIHYTKLYDRGTDGNTGRFGAVIAQTGIIGGRHAGRGDTRSQAENPVTVELSGDLPLGFTGDDAGVAAHALIDIDDHAILHSYSPSEVNVSLDNGKIGPTIS